MFRSEIPNIALPVAFREAIGFVQELGIQYIWIDSLCIIQDGARSNDDWTFESSRMKFVYSNSPICLSLDRARSPQDSVIYGPDVQFMTPFEINTTGIFDENNLAAESKRCAVFSSQHFNNALYDQPLGSRAWALQERMLPPRVLGFGEGELFWSCRQIPHACESLPSGTASLPDRSLGLRSSFIPITSDSANLYDTWFGLVMDYSGRRLTCPEKDKLVAMSAVASLMETATKDKCIVGHFWKSIPFSLTWDGFETPFHGSDESLEIRKRLRIPSWSWASEHRTVLSTDAFWAYKYSHAPLASADGFFEPLQNVAEGHMLPSLLLELSVFHIRGTIICRPESNEPQDCDHTFIIDHSDDLVRNVLDCAVSLDRNGGADAKAVFCPISLAPWGDESEYAHGLFQVETDSAVDGRKVYERIASGYIKLKPGLSWMEK